MANFLCRCQLRGQSDGMTRGHGDEYSRHGDGTESRQRYDSGGVTVVLPDFQNRLTPEQTMLGFSPHADAGTAEAQNALQPEVRAAVVPRTDWRLRWQLFCDKAYDACLFEYERGTVFLLQAVAAGAGAVFYFSLVSEPYWAELAVPAVLFTGLFYLLRDTVLRRTVLTLIMAFIAGMCAAKLETQRLATPLLGSPVSTQLTARIVSMQQEAGTKDKAGRWRIVADVLATEKPHLRYAPQRLRLSARDLPALAETGAVIKGPVRLRPHGGPVRSGQYDFAFHGYFRAIGGNGFYLGVPTMADEPAGKPPRWSWSADMALMIEQFRAGISGRIMEALSGEEGAIASALISGQRAGISDSTNEALRIAGLAHILSISGLHLALAAGIVMVSVRGFAGFFPSLSLIYPIKKIAALISLISSAFYLAVSGADVAAQRSFIMLGVMLCAVLLDRQALTMRNLAIAALFSIILTPHEILGPSFQMSFAATGALIAGFSWWKYRKRQKAHHTERQSGLFLKLRQFLGGVAATSLLAGTASGLYAAYHFNNMAPLGMLGNALAMPAISFLIMPFAVMALLLMPLGLDYLPLQVMGKGIELVKWIAHFVADISPELIPGLITPVVLLLWTAALIAATILSGYLRLIALVLVLAGGIVMMMKPLPDIIISEDARLVAVRQNDRLLVNRPRPSAFVMDNWRKAYGAKGVVAPVSYDAERSEGFACDDGLCSFDFADGRVLAYAAHQEAAQIACAIGDIVILAFAGDKSCAAFTQRHNIGNAVIVAGNRDAAHINATSRLAVQDLDSASLGARQPLQDHSENTIHRQQPKSLNEPLIIHRQQLALKGAAEIYLPSQNENIDMAIVSYAVGAPQRPWHLYRLYSRAARNIAERN